MIRDQADELRQLALRHAVRHDVPHAAPVPLVAVAGGKGGVGSTTIAVNLAAQLALFGHRTMLVDADLTGPDATAMCGLDAGCGLLDVLSGHRDLHEVLLAGPAGIQVLPGAWPSRTETKVAAGGHSRLMEQLRSLRSHVEAVVVDAGNGVRRDSDRFWRQTDLVLLATKPDDVSVMDTYAAIKVLLPMDCPTPVFTVINRVNSPDEAGAVHRRLAYACRRFLGRPIGTAGHLAEDPHAAEAAAAFSPLVLHRPRSRAAVAVAQLAQFVIQRLSLSQNAQTEGSRQRAEGSEALARESALCPLPTFPPRGTHEKIPGTRQFDSTRRHPAADVHETTSASTAPSK